MRSLKKLITLVLALAMVLTSVGITAMAASFSDITDEKVASAVDKLVAHKIITGYEDGTFRPDNQITRAEFAAIVTRMKGVADNLAADAVTGFSDLDNDASRAWARPYVKAAVDLKIINGFEDGTFRAGEPVTYEQAVKMLVCAVGYEVVAQSEYNKALISNPNATWSAGYIAAANKHGITKGVITAQISQPASRGVVAVLTSNALEVPELVTDEQGNLTKPEEGNEETESNIKTITGVIAETFYTGLDKQDTGLAEKEIKITNADENNGVYVLSEECYNENDMNELIGKRADIYYDSLNREVIRISAKSVSSVVIEEGSIESISADTVSYRNARGTTQSESLSGYTFIVNGKYMENYDLENEFKNGSIELFSSGGYKIAKITNFIVFVVSKYDRDNEKVYLKYEKYNGENFYQFPARSADLPLIYVKNSGSSKYELTELDNLSLNTYDVINFMQSPSEASGNTYRKMYVTKGAKKGKVTSNLNEERLVELDRTEMYLTQQYADYTPKTSSDDAKAPFEMDDSYTYYLDYTGQIAAVNYNPSTSSTTYNYGYLVVVDKRAEELGIVDSNGEYSGYTLKSSVKVDGESGKSRDEVFDLLETSASIANSKTTYGQPIKYSVNNKVIDAIDTVNTKDGGNNDSFTYDGYTASVKPTTSSVKVDSKTYAMNSDTIVMYVPENRDDTDDYEVMKPSVAFQAEKSYEIEVFGVDQNSANKLAKLVLVYGDINPLYNFVGNSPYMLVTENLSGGEKLRGYVGGSTPTISVSEDKFVKSDKISDNSVSASDVSAGDVIRYIQNLAGDIVAIEMVYDASEAKFISDKNEYSSTLGNVSDFYARLGGVVVAKDGQISVTTTPEADDVNENAKNYTTSSVQVYKYKDGKVNTSSIEDIVTIDGDGETSTVLLITHSVSSGAAAKVIYIVK